MNMYDKALLIQSAVNLSGVAFDLPDIAQEVWDELRKEKKDAYTKAFNSHPVMRLIAEQFMHLTRGIDYSDAYKVCKEKSNEAH